MSFQYAPQQGRLDNEIREFLEILSGNINGVPREDLLMVTGDMNCHTGSTCDGFEDMMGYFSLRVRSQKG